MSRSIFIYTTTVSLVGFAIVLWALTHFTAYWPGFLVFAGLAVVAEWTNVELLPISRSRVSVSSVIAMASILLFGPLGGVLIHTISGVTTALTTTLQSTNLKQKNRASLLQRTGFNIGMFVTSIAVAGFVYIAVGGSVDQVAKITNVIPLILAVTTDYVINIGLLVGVIALQTQSAPLNIWKENFLWTAPIATIGAAIGSATLGLGYQFYHFYGVMLFLIPGLLIRYSYKLNVGRKNRVV